MVSKGKAALLAFAFIAVSFFVPLSDTDAESVEIMDGISFSTDDIDIDGLNDLLSIIVDSMETLNGDSLEMTFSDGPESNYDKLLQKLKEISDPSYTESELKDVINYFGVIAPLMMVSPGFDSNGNLQINDGGSIKAAIDFPEYMLRMLLGDDSESVEVYGSSEIGLIIDMTATEQIVADKDIERIGLLSSDVFRGVSDMLGRFGFVAKNVVVNNNPDLLTGIDMEIRSGAVYDAVTDIDLSAYCNFSIDTNLGSAASGDELYLYFNVELLMKGDISTELTKVSGTGPSNIASELSIKGVDVGLSFGFVDIMSSSSPGIHLGIDRILFDISYEEDVDGEAHSMNVSNSSLMAFANKIDVTMRDSGSGIKDVTISNPDSIPSKSPGSESMRSILDAAKSSSMTESTSDPKMQYMIGAALCLIGFIIIIAMAAGKKY